MWRRESLLARLFIVLGGVAGIEECVRNRGDLPTEKRPAITLLDADEVANRSGFDRGRPSGSPNLVILSPEIYVVLKNEKPTNPTAGTQLNTVCAAIIKAVAADPQLNDLVGSNGEIRYDGLVTDMGEDRSMTGKARVAISFVYPFRTDEL